MRYITLAKPMISFDKMVLYALQQEIRDHPARYKVVALGRQSGKSYYARRDALEKANNEGKRVWWVAPTISAAKQHWDMVVRMLTEANFPVAKMSLTDKQIDFHSGGFLRIRSADTPNNLRGATLDHIIIDEAAFMLEEVWFEILWPMITATGGTALFLSTPNGRNWFWRLYSMGLSPDEPEWMSWRAPSWLSPYQDKKTIEQIKKVTPKRVFDQEYGAEFLADGGGVFTGLEEAAKSRPLAAPEPDGEYLAGIDWGGSGEDFSTITIVDRANMKQVYGKRFANMGPTNLVEQMTDVLHLWRPSKTYVERVGIGEPMLRILRRYMGVADDDLDDVETLTDITRIVAVYTTNEVKREMVEKLAALIEFKSFDILKPNEADPLDYGNVQISEMSTFEATRTASGLSITYKASSNNHDDTVMALVLATKGLPRRKAVDVVAKIQAEKVRAARKKAGPLNPFRNGKIKYTKKAR